MERSRRFPAIAALALSALAVTGCVSGGRPLSDEEIWDRFVGTWVNVKYSGMVEPQKVVIKPAYLAEDWKTSTDSARDAEWKASFKKGWVDSNGNSYCQCYARYTEKYLWTNLLLMRVNRSGRMLEMVFRKGLEDGEYPTLIDPKARSDVKDWYCVYYRK